jgi:di/tricarboxylate transporter
MAASCDEGSGLAILPKMAPLWWHSWMVAGVLAGAVALMIRGRAPDMVLIAGVVALVVAGVIDARDAALGFGNEGLVSVAALFIVAGGMQNTGMIRWVAAVVLRGGGSLRSVLANLCATSALVSSVINNTPLVAVLTPAALDFARRERISPSKLLMPMCFAVTLGGTLTLIGTSSNLVVAGLVEADAKVAGSGIVPIGFFDFTVIGIIVAAVGLAFLILAAPTLLPDRVPVLQPTSDARQYTARLAVVAGGSIDGKSIAEAGLRRLQGLFLVEIERGDDSISAPAPSQRLRGGDHLVFAGAVDEIVALRRVAGLSAVDEAGSASVHRGRSLVEAVVSNSFPGVNQSIREFGFRARYDAAVIAVARNGERLAGRIGDIVLRAGDTLLIETDAGFLERNRRSQDFYLVSGVQGGEVRPERAGIALVIVVAMIAAATATGNMLGPALAAAIAMVATGCLRASDARSSIDLSILLVIGAGLGLSEAVERSGLGMSVGQFVVGLGSGSVIASLAAVYLATALITNFISNAATAAIVYPLAVGTAVQAHADPMPFVFAVLFASSAAFSTPIGYQTNLMVYGPGGYRFSDFVRFGLPLNALLFVVTVAALAWRHGLVAAP